jgi:hypothetical protein
MSDGRRAVALRGLRPDRRGVVTIQPRENAVVHDGDLLLA